MPVIKKRTNFAISEEGIATKQMLQSMEADAGFNTTGGYSADTSTYPDNKIPFVDKHMKYLSEHQAVDLQHYLSNLRLMTRIK